MELLITKDEHIARFTFNRPDKKNAMSMKMGNMLEDAVHDINNDPDIRVVIVTGKGNVFSSGGDLDMLREHTNSSAEENYEFMVTFYKKYFSLLDLTVPSIAMINGHAIGAGLCVSLACDLRYIQSAAKVGVTFVRIGLNVGMAGSYMLPLLMGKTKAAELLLTGKLIPAEEAYQYGLVNAVFSEGELEEKTAQIAREIASQAPLAVAYTKKSMNRGFDKKRLFEVFDAEARGQAVCYHSTDLLEGIEAVKAKRKPLFQGR